MTSHCPGGHGHARRQGRVQHGACRQCLDMGRSAGEVWPAMYAAALSAHVTQHQLQRMQAAAVSPRPHGMVQCQARACLPPTQQSLQPLAPQRRCGDVRGQWRAESARPVAHAPPLAVVFECQGAQHSARCAGADDKHRATMAPSWPVCATQWSPRRHSIARCTRVGFLRV